MVALGYSGWAQAMMSTAITPEQVRATANAGFVPVATLAEADDAGIDVTEPPTPRVQVPATAPLAPLGHVDKARLLQAAMRARRAFPGPVGMELAEILTSWADFGFRLGAFGRIAKLVDAIEGAPVSEPEPAVAAA